MSNRLPIHFNPEHASACGLTLSGEMSLEKLSRLHDRLVAPFGKIHVELAFGKQRKRAFVNGILVGQMHLVCQRCLDEFEQPINHKFRLGFITSEGEIPSLLPDEEPLLVTEDDMRIEALVEEEIELILPMVATHSAKDCSTGIMPASEAAAPDEEPKRKNPFLVLESIKSKQIKE